MMFLGRVLHNPGMSNNSESPLGMLRLLTMGLACKNEFGKTVDSWFALKEPGGADYLYYQPSQGIAPSPFSMNDTQHGALSYTVSQLWNSNIDYILFNDEALETAIPRTAIPRTAIPRTAIPMAATAYGHAKGIWAWSGPDAFLLTHSIPLFPTGPSDSPAYVGLGPNAHTYAQTLACFSLRTADLATLATQAMLNAPHVYDSRVGPNAPPALRALSNGTKDKRALCTATPFNTVGSTGFTFFAKSAQWNNELYSACLAPRIQSGLLAETWIRGSATGPACGEYGVLDIQALRFSGNVSFKETQDHSKWAVSTRGSSVCVADINRMTTQYKRGGGAICWNDTMLSSVLRGAIMRTDSCD